MNIKNKLTYFFPVLYAVLTLIIALNKVPFWDETHAFEIAGFKFSQIFYLTRIEGHTLLWYLILKPFSSLNLYPYSMIIINWVFAVAAVFVLWMKSPFSVFTKTLIIFSAPFLFYFGPVARCYAIGLLFLFLICSYFKERFKRPRLLSVLLLICSNTSIVAFIPCFCIWLMFIFQLIKKKSANLKFTLIMFAINAFLLLIQFYNFQKPFLTKHEKKNFIDLFLSFVVFPYNQDKLCMVFNVLVFVLLYYLFYYLYKKTKYGFYLYFSLFTTLSVLFIYFYNGSLWNYYFYLVYLIVVIWIFHRQIRKNKLLKFIINSVLIFLCFSFLVYDNNVFEKVYDSNSKTIAKIVASNTDIKNSNYYCLDWWSDISPGSDLYFKKYGIDILDVLSQKRTSFESVKNIFIYKVMVLDFDKFYASLDRTKKNYILTDGVLFYMDKLPNSENYFLKNVYTDTKLKFSILELVKK